jgi:hypothetical protein
VTFAEPIAPERSRVRTLAVIGLDVFNASRTSQLILIAERSCPAAQWVLGVPPRKLPVGQATLLLLAVSLSSLAQLLEATTRASRRAGNPLAASPSAAARRQSISSDGSSSRGGSGADAGEASGAPLDATVAQLGGTLQGGGARATFVRLATLWFAAPEAAGSGRGRSVFCRVEVGAVVETEQEADHSASDTAAGAAGGTCLTHCRLTSCIHRITQFEELPTSPAAASDPATTGVAPITTQLGATSASPFLLRMLRSAGAFSDSRSGRSGANANNEDPDVGDDPNALDVDEEDPQFNLTLRDGAVNSLGAPARAEPRPVADHVPSKGRTSAVTDGLSVLRGRVGPTVPVVDSDVTLLRLDVTA